MSKKNIQFKFLKKKNLCQFKNFFFKYYKKKYNLKNLKWEYYLNPFGQAKILIAKQNKKIIGSLIAIPLKFILKKKKQTVYRIQNVLVEKKFRGLQIFSNLIKKFNNHISNNKKCISFPNSYSLNGFLNQKWNKHFEIKNLIKNIRKNKNYKNKICNFVKIKNFNDTHTIFFKKILNENKLDIFSNKSYLNWRFVNNTRTKYNCFEIKNKNVLIGLVAISHYKILNYRIGQICLILSSNYNLKKIIDFCSYYCSKNNLNRLSVWTNSYLNIFKKKGFYEYNSTKKFMIYRNISKSQINKINLFMHLSDVY